MPEHDIRIRTSTFDNDFVQATVVTYESNTPTHEDTIRECNRNIRNLKRKRKGLYPYLESELR